jgi:hypothetical protein
MACWRPFSLVGVFVPELWFERLACPDRRQLCRLSVNVALFPHVPSPRHTDFHQGYSFWVFGKRWGARRVRCEVIPVPRWELSNGSRYARTMSVLQHLNQ